MRTVVLDAGHGGIDPGAVGHGLKECDVALDITLQAADLLAERTDILALVTHEGKLNPNRHYELYDRVDFSNRNEADVFVSVHCNAFVRPTAHGHECYHFPGSVNGSRLARAIFNAVRGGITEIQPRAVREANFEVLRDTKAPAALLECAFVSNPGDADFLSRKAFRSRYASVLAQGILDFFGLE